MKISFKKPSRAPTAPRRRVPNTIRETPRAFSYYARRSDYNENTGRTQGRSEAEITAKDRKAYLLQRLGALVAGTAVLFMLVAIMSLSTSPRVVLLPSGAASSRYFLHDTATYGQATARLLRSSIWNRNKLTVNTEQVETSLQKQFPEISGATITLPLLSQQPIVYLQPAQPVLIWTDSRESYIVSENGKALTSLNHVPANTNLQLQRVTDQTGTAAAVGKTVLTKADVTFIRTVIGELQAQHLTIAGLTLPPAAGELDVRLSGLNYFVKFNMHESADARRQAGAFLAVQHKLKSQNITPAEYIDVRVDGRAYYK